MFRVENNVPDVYVNESRDFQLFSRLYDLVFQSARFSIDSIEQSSDTMRCNDALLPLIATKVGFFTDLKLTNKSDRKVLSAFPYIIRYKGSAYGIELVTNLFEQITNTKVSIQKDLEDSSHLTIVFEDYTPNVDLLYSLLEYIRPTGLLIDYKVYSNVEVAADFVTNDSVNIHIMNELHNPDDSVDSGSGIVIQTSNSDKINYPVEVAFGSNVGFTQILQFEGDTNNEQ